MNKRQFKDPLPSICFDQTGKHQTRMAEISSSVLTGGINLLPILFLWCSKASDADIATFVY